MKKFLSEFKTFVARGNVMDMAVGVIVGGAFSTISRSLIDDVLMPLLNTILGGVDFSSWVVSLPSLYGGEPVEMRPGLFVNSVVNFVVLAFCVFLMVRAMNRLHKKKKEAPAPKEPDPQVVLLTEIRDLLKEQEGEKK